MFRATSFRPESLQLDTIAELDGPRPAVQVNGGHAGTTFGRFVVRNPGHKGELAAVDSPLTKQRTLRIFNGQMAQC